MEPQTNRWKGTWICECGASGAFHTAVHKVTNRGTLAILCPQCKRKVSWQRWTGE